MTEQPSGKLYTAVTKYWPRITVGIVFAVGVAGWAIEGLTADSGIEFYLMAWGATTGGLWFMFEKAEKALSDESRGKVVGWLRQNELSAGIESIPAQFAFLFDRIFGERHLTWRCFRRSAVVSAASLLTILTALSVHTSSSQFPIGVGAKGWVTIGLVVALVNILPDYLSLLETRWTLRLATEGRRTLSWVLAIDLALTFFLSAGSVLVVLTLIYSRLRGEGLDQAMIYSLRDLLNDSTMAAALGSAFFTSVWLWLYAASVPRSRVLVRMNDGVGFLLRVTDVEKQPFRSLGFVSVIIVSGLFALGLPLVLL